MSSKQPPDCDNAGANHRTVDPVLRSLDRDVSRHLRQMRSLLLVGVCLPGVCGVGAAGLAVLFNLGWTGMDSYVPFILGGIAGCVIAAGLAGAGLVQFVQARRTQRQRDQLAG